jgi:enoyl-CoA hydratase
MQASADPVVRVIVLSGAGRDFSAGHDVKQMGAVSSSRERSFAQMWTAYERARQMYTLNHLAWRNIPKPTIAMVQGYCIFGGWMVASTMDFIFAAEDALFLATPWPADYWTVPWELGTRKAKQLMFENRFLDAREALKTGLVNEVFSSADLERETLAYAERVAENDPLWLRDTKLFINQVEDGMGFTQSVLAAWESGARRQRPNGWSQYGQIGPDGEVRSLGDVNPFSRVVQLARRKLRGLA